MYLYLARMLMLVVVQKLLLRLDPLSQLPLPLVIHFDLELQDMLLSTPGPSRPTYSLFLAMLAPCGLWKSRLLHHAS